jgi:transcription elongation GreA/GreB family factor
VTSRTQRVDKRALVAALRAQIAEDLAVATRAARDAATAATHEENKPENDKDMRSTEASYLARGQAERVRELERSDNALQFLTLRDADEGEPIALGAVVTVDLDGARITYFIAPAGGGMRTRVGGIEVQVITPEAPLGKALVGRTAGDVASVRVRGAEREYEIVEVT